MTGEKKVNGRKRQCWVDTHGFLVRVLVHPADISDTEGAAWLLAAHHHAFPRMQEIRVDEGYKQGLDTWLQQNTAIRLKRAIRKPDLWYHDSDHAVLIRSNLVCHDVHFDPIQRIMRPI